MSNTFSQIYVQVVFAVKSRESFIKPEWEERLYKYVTGIVQMKSQKMLAINGIPNHIHFFIGMQPNCCLSDLVREVKKSSNEFVKDNSFCKNKFSWQEGFGAFSYSHSQIDKVISYIMRQKQHHKKTTFKEEYIGFLKKYSINYDDHYLFDWID